MSIREKMDDLQLDLERLFRHPLLSERERTALEEMINILEDLLTEGSE